MERSRREFLQAVSVGPLSLAVFGEGPIANTESTQETV